MKLNQWIMGAGLSLLLFGFVAVIISTIEGCNNKQDEKSATVKEQTPMRDINEVLTDHTAELMPIPGVTGVAVGQLDDSTPCILVLVVSDSASMVGKIPKTLEGYPTKIEVTGKIVPMDEK